MNLALRRLRCRGAEATLARDRCDSFTPFQHQGHGIGAAAAEPEVLQARGLTGWWDQLRARWTNSTRTIYFNLENLAFAEVMERCRAAWIGAFGNH